MNTNVKKNAISFDIDFENIKSDTITTKNNEKEKAPKRAEVIPNYEDPNEANKEQVLYQCPNCSRKFKREAYAKHVPICQRVFQGKKEIKNPKNDEIKEKLEKNNTKEKKGFGKSKWENQSNELRAIIQSKRAENNEIHKDKEIKIEIEQPKKHENNIIIEQKSPINNSKTLYNIDEKGYYQCELCSKKFTKLNFENHLPDCKLKYKDKKNGTFFTKKSFGNNNVKNTPVNRQPTMPAVTYGGLSSNKPFSLKFGK